MRKQERMRGLGGRGYIIGKIWEPKCIRVFHEPLGTASDEIILVAVFAHDSLHRYEQAWHHFELPLGLSKPNHNVNNIKRDKRGGGGRRRILRV